MYLYSVCIIAIRDSIIIIIEDEEEVNSVYFMVGISCSLFFNLYSKDTLLYKFF